METAATSTVASRTPTVLDATRSQTNIDMKINVNEDPMKTSSSKDSSLSNNTVRNENSGNNTIGVGDFVAASFASFEKAYGHQHQTSGRVNAELNMSSADLKHLDNMEDEDDESPWAHLPWHQTIFYSFLPFLIFCARRSMFGVASLLRSFLIGHTIRLLMAFFPSIRSAYKSSTQFLKKKICNILCISMGVMNINVGDNHSKNNYLYKYHLYAGPGASASGNNSYHSNNNNNHNWLHCLQVMIVGKLGGDPHSCPPPSLALLGLLTILAFVVHPDGLTWVFFGKLRDGHIPTLVASGSVAAILALGGVIHRASVSSKIITSSKQSRKERHSGNNHHNKGKKRRGGRRGGGGGGGHHNHERRSSRHSSRIKHGHINSNNDSSRILSSLSETTEVSESGVKNAGNKSNRKESNSRETQETPQYVSVNPSTEILERKWTDPTPDDGSATSSLSMISMSSAILESNGNSSNNDNALSHDSTQKETEKQVILDTYNKSTLLPSSTDATANNPHIHNKKDHRRSKKPKKLHNGNASNRNHRQKNSSYVSPKQSSRKSPSYVCSPSRKSSHAFRQSSSLRTQDTSLMDGFQKPYRNNNIYTRVQPLKSEIFNKKSSINQGGTSNSYFSSLPTPPTFSNQTSTIQASPSVISSPNAAGKMFKMNEIHDRTKGSLGSAFSSSFQGFSLASSESEDSLCQTFSNSNAYKAPGAHPVPINIQPNNRNIQYSIPTDYSHTYTHNYNSIPKNPGKIELAGLLAQAGLIGRSCAHLLRDIPDVDALERLTEQQYDIYHVSNEARFHIKTLLNARKRRKEISCSYGRSLMLNSSSSTKIRPPPGLGFGEMPNLTSVVNNDHLCSSPEVVASAVNENQSSLTNQYFQSRHESKIGLDLPILHEGHNIHDNLSSLTMNVSTSNHCNIRVPASGLNASSLVADRSNSLYNVEKKGEEEEDSSSIEADLLAQVGGQMAVSILDF